MGGKKHESQFLTVWLCCSASDDAADGNFKAYLEQQKTISNMQVTTHLAKALHGPDTEFGKSLFPTSGTYHSTILRLILQADLCIGIPLVDASAQTACCDAGQ